MRSDWSGLNRAVNTLNGIYALSNASSYSEHEILMYAQKQKHLLKFCVLLYNQFKVMGT